MTVPTSWNPCQNSFLYTVCDIFSWYRYTVTLHYLLKRSILPKWVMPCLSSSRCLQIYVCVGLFLDSSLLCYAKYSWYQHHTANYKPHASLDILRVESSTFVKSFFFFNHLHLLTFLASAYQFPSDLSLPTVYSPRTHWDSHLTCTVSAV